MNLAARKTASEAETNPAAPSWPTQQTAPEDVLLVWLLRLPAETDIAGAARVEIARLDQAAPLCPGPQRLRALLIQLMAAA